MDSRQLFYHATYKYTEKTSYDTHELTFFKLTFTIRYLSIFIIPIYIRPTSTKVHLSA